MQVQGKFLIQKRVLIFKIIIDMLIMEEVYLKMLLLVLLMDQQIIRQHINNYDIYKIFDDKIFIKLMMYYFNKIR